MGPAASLGPEKEFRELTLQVIAEALLSLSPEESDRVFPELYLPIMEEVPPPLCPCPMPGCTCGCPQTTLMVGQDPIARLNGNPHNPCGGGSTPPTFAVRKKIFLCRML